MIMLILYMFLSIFWSSDPTMTSLKRWTRELIAVIMAFFILTEIDLRKSLESIVRRSIYVLVPFSLLLVLFFPEHGVESFGGLEAWVGVTTHKNGLGRLCYIAVFFLVWALVGRWPVRDLLLNRYHIYLDILVLGMAVYLLKGPGIGKTISLTSVITLTVGLVILFSLLWLKKLKRYPNVTFLKAIALAGIVLGTASVFIGGLVVGGDLASSFGREATLTGRTAIWSELIPFAMKEPIIGHGIDGFFTDAMKKSLGNLPHSHNGYLEIILDYGFVGLFFFSMFLLNLCGKANKILYYDYNWGSLLICILFMIVIYNVAEPSIETFTSYIMAILLFLSVSSAAIQNDCSERAYRAKTSSDVSHDG